MGSFINITAYAGSASYTFDKAVDTSLVTGLTYRFRLRAHNSKGYSDYTSIISAALADLPDQASQPTKIKALSSNTSIAIQWTSNTNHQTPGGDVTGYKIFVDDGLNGEFTEIFYGKNVPSLNEYIVTGLIPSRGYRFKI